MREVSIDDNLTCGLKTDEVLSTEPYGFRVVWINWDSPLRESGMEIGDTIVAVDGVAYRREHRTRERAEAVGQHLESQRWANAGARDGQAVTLTVKRGPRVLDVGGALRAQRQWLDDEGKQTMGPNGPVRRDSDDFDGPWSSWYEDLVKFASAVLDAGWREFVSDNRRSLAQHRDGRPRVVFLREHYPGPFADVTVADWEKVDACLLGRRYELDEAALTWRGGDAQPGGTATLPDPQAPPEKVVEAHYAALKRGDEATWRALFATWRAQASSVTTVEGRASKNVVFEPQHQQAQVDFAWDYAREVMLGRVYDVRVVAVDDVQTLVTEHDVEDVPRVEQVAVEVEHIGLIDGEYRAFIEPTFHRVRELQRLGDGPWRLRATIDAVGI